MMYMQVATDEDLAAGLSLLADRLYSSSLSNDGTGVSEIPEKCPKQSMHESSLATVTMAAEVVPFAAETQFVTSSATANQATLISNLSAADWPTPAMLDPAVQTQTTAVIPLSLATLNSAVPSTTPAKKVIVLVARRPVTSTVSQSQSHASIVTSCSDTADAAVTPTECTSQLNNSVVISAAEADSMVMQLTPFHTEFSSQELVTSCVAGSSSRYLGSSDHSQSLGEHLGSSGSSSYLGSLEGHLGSAVPASTLSTLEEENCMLLGHTKTNVPEQENMVDDEVQTSTPVDVGRQSMMTTQFFSVSDL